MLKNSAQSKCELPLEQSAESLKTSFGGLKASRCERVSRRYHGRAFVILTDAWRVGMDHTKKSGTTEVKCFRLLR